MLGAPELNTELRVGCHESIVEGENHLPRPGGHASFDAAQDAVGFLGCKRTLPGHVELLVTQHPQVLLCRAALSPLNAQPVFVLGIQVQCLGCSFQMWVKQHLWLSSVLVNLLR